MSFIDSQNTEECATDVSLKIIKYVLQKNGYSINETKFNLIAVSGGGLSSYRSTITIIDNGNIKMCKDEETSKGYMLRPKTGVLMTIIKEAEALDRKIKNPEYIKKVEQTFYVLKSQKEQLENKMNEMPFYAKKRYKTEIDKIQSKMDMLSNEYSLIKKLKGE